MKCLLLAGGRGDRLWPLSRKNYPKQFIEIKNNHSIFQETVARNMAFCDEFIIVTNKEYQDIIENQMKVFRGLTYRCIYEENGRKTTAAIVSACQQLPLSELLFVVTSDHLIEGESYKNDILKAKVPYVVGDILSDYEHEKGMVFSYSEKEDTLLEHCLKSLFRPKRFARCFAERFDIN